MLINLPLAPPDSRLDRDAATRAEPEALHGARLDANARVLVASPQRLAVCAPDAPEDGARETQFAETAAGLDSGGLLLLTLEQAEEAAARVGGIDLWDGALRAGEAEIRQAPDSNPDSPQPPAGEAMKTALPGLAYLGRGPDGPLFALLMGDALLEEALPSGDSVAPGCAFTWRVLWEVAVSFTGAQAEAATTATALAAWHATHPRCPRCGAPTRVVQGGWVRVCPVEGSQHFPRTDPAVIMAITDADDRVLLGHARHFPPKRYSCLAGFVESGESAENAVRREVFEESGIEVGRVEYLASQPWPFPRSLMLGFRGYTAQPQPMPRADREEMGDVRFFSREELTQAIEVGDVILPPGASIARSIITHWFGGPLPEPRGASS